MISLSIDKILKDNAPDLVLGIIKTDIKVEKHNDSLWEEIDIRIKEIQEKIAIEAVDEISEIRALRDAYRALGKEPSRYRGSNEALIRRILQGKGLYEINTVVDINNFISLESLHSVGSYDLAKLKPPIIFRMGSKGESYKRINKEIINIEQLPIFADALGPFGSPTSDSERAMITESTTELMMIIIAFAGVANLEKYIEHGRNLLEKYAGGQNIETAVVR